MDSHRPLLDQVFILRFWREKAGVGERGRWRVLVRNINTRRRDVVDGVAHAFSIVTSNLTAQIGEQEALDRPAEETSVTPGRQRKRTRGPSK
jgi:hypothetical protein